MNNDTIFTRLGLPKHSAQVYEYLEKNGPSSVTLIAQAISTFRPAVYRALNSMKETRLVSKRVFGRRTFYSAESRLHIVELFNNASLRVGDYATQGEETDIKSTMGAIRYFEGDHSIAAIYNDIIEHTRRGDTFYRYTSEKDLNEVNKLLPVGYRKRRDNKRLERLVISNRESARQKRNRLERFIKYFGSEKESFHQNAIQLIYGTRMAFIDLNTRKGFIIDNATLAEFQKTIFHALYKRL